MNVTCSVALSQSFELFPLDRVKSMKRINWQIWTGFILSLIAGFSYSLVFIRWPITREFPWANLILFAIALVFLFLGLRRAFNQTKESPQKYSAPWRRRLEYSISQ